MNARSRWHIQSWFKWQQSSPSIFQGPTKCFVKSDMPYTWTIEGFLWKAGVPDGSMLSMLLYLRQFHNSKGSLITFEVRKRECQHSVKPPVVGVDSQQIGKSKFEIPQYFGNKSHQSLFEKLLNRTNIRLVLVSLTVLRRVEIFEQLQPINRSIESVERQAASQRRPRDHPPYLNPSLLPSTISRVASHLASSYMSIVQSKATRASFSLLYLIYLLSPHVAHFVVLNLA